MSEATEPPVVIGYDGIDEAVGALSWALEELPPDTPIIIVSATGRERRLPLPLPRAPRADLLRARLEALWMQDDEVLDDEAELRVEEGPPAATLARIAAQRGARLIVVGHRPRGSLGALRSSVAHDLLDRSSVPVLVVP
jgi:nucleotide-binding universal stress UspA family protein